jgi:YHS domain-containing protein
VATAGAAGQFLITEDLRDAAGHIADADFTSLPPRRLKGIPHPICLVEVGRRTPDRSDRATDPVCGLTLPPDDVASRVTWQGTPFAFCCNMCEQAFAENPTRFIAAQQD